MQMQQLKMAREQEKVGGGGVDRTTSADRTTQIKVDPLRLETMLELIGELVVIKSQLAHNPLVGVNSGNAELQALITHFDRTVRDLQEKTLSLRLTPIKPLFMKIQRTIRDIALKQQKSVELVFEGDDTEIDRSLIDAVTDPLMHIARNAVDHGMESDTERAAAKKVVPGRISLTARTLGDRVIVEMRDNGRGIDRERVLSKARERGLIGVEQGADFTNNEVFNLLFEPGFSTAEKVTEVSGRGVGLDVVRTQLEKVRGHVDIDSKLGEGSAFRLSLPLTTAITEGMYVKFGGVSFILPLSGVREIVRTSQYKVTRIDSGAKVLGLRGRFLPLVDLSAVLQFNDLKRATTTSRGLGQGRPEKMTLKPGENAPQLNPDSIAIVAEHSGGLSVLLVDEVIGQIQVVVKGLSETVRKTEGLTGGAILGDGSVALVLDLDGIAREYHRWLNLDRPMAV
jgi:two-component system chemotaxis sensor kinase CheA